ncbi:MAG: hypothetical protein ACUVXF_10420 [Desulfobaccales bacterium]
MSEYFVAGGIYQDHTGKEKFALIGPNLEEPPFLMVDGLRRYFGRLCQQGHLYRVEEDLTLSLVAQSHQALEWGVKAPERVVLEPELRGKLEALITLC